MTAAEVKEALRAYICTELMQNPDFPLRDEEPLITGGLIDSFSLAYIAVYVETRFNVYIPDVDLTVEKMDTLEQMASRVLQDGE